MNTRIISVINQKGGVGKTTSVQNICFGLTLLGKKVLIVDLDPQANLTDSSGIKLDEVKYTIIDVLNGSVDPRNVILKVMFKGLNNINNFISIIPANIMLSNFEESIFNIKNKEFLLKNCFNSIFLNYDFVFFDCPSSFNIITLNAFVASNEIFIPVQPEYLSLIGMNKLVEIIKIIKKKFNKKLEITGIIITIFDKRKKINREAAEKIKLYFVEKVFNTYIRDNVSLAEAPSFCKDIFSYKPKSNGSKDYMNLCIEIIEMEDQLK
jgi:chromosome partitioning protein